MSQGNRKKVSVCFQKASLGKLGSAGVVGRVMQFAWGYLMLYSWYRGVGDLWNCILHSTSILLLSFSPGRWFPLPYKPLCVLEACSLQVLLIARARLGF